MIISRRKQHGVVGVSVCFESTHVSIPTFRHSLRKALLMGGSMRKSIDNALKVSKRNEEKNEAKKLMFDWLLIKCQKALHAYTIQEDLKEWPQYLGQFQATITYANFLKFETREIYEQNDINRTQIKRFIQYVRRVVLDHHQHHKEKEEFRGLFPPPPAQEDKTIIVKDVMKCGSEAEEDSLLVELIMVATTLTFRAMTLTDHNNNKRVAKKREDQQEEKTKIIKISMDEKSDYLTKKDDIVSVGVKPMCRKAISLYNSLMQLEDYTQIQTNENELREQIVDYMTINTQWAHNTRLMKMYGYMQKMWYLCIDSGKNNIGAIKEDFKTEFKQSVQPSKTAYRTTITLTTPIQDITNVTQKDSYDIFLDVVQTTFEEFDKTIFQPHELKWPIFHNRISFNCYELMYDPAFKMDEYCPAWFIDTERKQKKAAEKEMEKATNPHGYYLLNSNAPRKVLEEDLELPKYRLVILCSAFLQLKRIIIDKLTVKEEDEDAPEGMDMKEFTKDLEPFLFFQNQGHYYYYHHHSYAADEAKTKEKEEERKEDDQQHCIQYKHVVCTWIDKIAAHMIKATRQTIKKTLDIQASRYLFESIATTAKTKILVRTAETKEILMTDISYDFLRVFFIWEDHVHKVSADIQNMMLHDCNSRYCGGSAYRLQDYILDSDYALAHPQMMRTWFNKHINPILTDNLQDMLISDRTKVSRDNKVQYILEAVFQFLSNLIVTQKVLQLNHATLPAYILVDLYRLLEMQHIWETDGLPILQKYLRAKLTKVYSGKPMTEDKLDKLCSATNTNSYVDMLALYQSALQLAFLGEDATKPSSELHKFCEMIGLDEVDKKCLVDGLFSKARCMGKIHAIVFINLYLSYF
jgi:hypothetical protein